MNIRAKLSRFLRHRVSHASSFILPPIVHGYIDELSATRVVGWMWNPYDPAARLEFDVAINLPEGFRVISTGRADQFYPGLQSVGDALYGFSVKLPFQLTSRERGYLVVVPKLSNGALQRAPKFEGFVDECSTNHVAGWIRNRFDPEERVAFEAVLVKPDAEQILAQGKADILNLALLQQSIGDGLYGFRILFPEPLSEEDRQSIIVRPVETSTPLPVSPYLVTAYEPIDHMAIDIVNNCNLRCPFCLFDYSGTKTTSMMSGDTFNGLLKLIPFVRDGNFWLSCLHEPTLNPEFLDFIERVPRQWRRKVMFTTNLAKRMPAVYFERMADSGISHINISLESRNPAIFERMRKGARWNIFSENWDRLINAWKLAPAAPRLRYIILAYKANLQEIPGLVKYLREERLPWQIEVRHTYNALHIPEDFSSTEFLDHSNWAWLEDQLGDYSVDEVMLIPPPDYLLNAANMAAPASPEAAILNPQTSAQSASFIPAQAEPASATAPVPLDIPLVKEEVRGLTQPFNIQVEWDGKFVVYGKWENPPLLLEFATTNINALPDPYAYLMSLQDNIE